MNWVHIAPSFAAAICSAIGAWLWFRASKVPLLVTEPLWGNDHYNQLAREGDLLAALGEMGRINAIAARWTVSAAVFSAIAACLG